MLNRLQNPVNKERNLQLLILDTVVIEESFPKYLVKSVDGELKYQTQNISYDELRKYFMRKRQQLYIIKGFDTVKLKREQTGYQDANSVSEYGNSSVLPGLGDLKENLQHLYNFQQNTQHVNPRALQRNPMTSIVLDFQT